MNIKAMIRLEGVATFLVAIFFYSLLKQSWLFFAILFLTPDLSMLGYLINKKIGSYTYNIVHNYILVVLLIYIGFQYKSTIALQLGLILLAHIGFDRLLGYGLKYSDSFKKTHIQKL